jgi:hypothetical protein
MSASDRITHGPPPKTQKNNRSVGSAAAVQSGNLTGRGSDTTQKLKAEDLRPKIDHAKLNRFILPRDLSKTWATNGSPGPFVLRSQPHIAIHRTLIRGGADGVEIEWSSPRTRGSGIGAVSLVAHVLGISDDEAAWRLAHWLAVGRFASDRGFLDRVTLQTEQVAA